MIAGQETTLSQLVIPSLQSGLQLRSFVNNVIHILNINKRFSIKLQKYI